MYAIEERKSKLLVGSIKANCGHCEAAAGALSIAKALLILVHSEVPGNAQLRQLNPHIANVVNDHIEFPTQLTKLHQSDFHVGVTGIGASGTGSISVLFGTPCLGTLGHVILTSSPLGDDARRRVLDKFGAINPAGYSNQKFALDLPLRANTKVAAVSNDPIVTSLPNVPELVRRSVGAVLVGGLLIPLEQVLNIILGERNLDENEPFGDMGVDSLGAIEVRNRLQEALPNLELPVAG